jgi:hypothetical protein
MKSVVVTSHYLSSDQRRLLGGWRDVMDDIKMLCRNLAALPDGCQCGNGEGHLKGTCPCCHTVALDRVPSCGDCDAELAGLRPAIDLLGVDTFRFFPFVKELLERDTTPELRARAGAVETHIAELIRTFGALVVAADQFRSDCRASHLTTLKTLATSLLGETDGLNRAI